MYELVLHSGKLCVLELATLKLNTASDGWSEPFPDTNLQSWSETVEQVTATYRRAKESRCSTLDLQEPVSDPS